MSYYRARRRPVTHQERPGGRNGVLLSHSAPLAIRGSLFHRPTRSESNVPRLTRFQNYHLFGSLSTCLLLTINNRLLCFSGLQ